MVYDWDWHAAEFQFNGRWNSRREMFMRSRPPAGWH
jgi:hypothetical protein